MSYRKKLIEVALPLEDINREAAREKSIRHGHPSTLHLWWARRPLAACRAVLFASLVDDPSERVPELLADATKRAAAERELKARKKAWRELKATFEKASGAGMKSVPDPGPEPKIEDVIEEQERERLFNIIRELVKWENSNNERVLKMAREEILKSTNGKPPPVYDPFCGGGSIPLEAQRLGLEAHASDLNPVPVLITKALIELPPKFAGKPPVNPEAKKKFTSSGSWKGAAGLAEDIRYYGQWMRDEAEKRIGHLYPKVKLPKEHGGGEATVIAWLWARTVKCSNPACRADMPLLKSFVLSTRSSKEAWLEPVVSRQSKTVRFTIKTGSGKPPEPPKTGRGANFRCLVCGQNADESHIRTESCEGRMSAQMTAIVADSKNGRTFLPADESHIKTAQLAKPRWKPDQPMNRETTNLVSGRGYGFFAWSDLFTNRQLAALECYSNLVGETEKLIRADAIAAGLDEEKATERARAIVTYLGLSVSKLADALTSFARWKPSMEQVIATFARQALPMVWDFAESNTFNNAAGDFSTTVSTIVRAVQNLPSGKPAIVNQTNAEALRLEDQHLVFSTDPPYYDNIAYADLSDFFYVWLRRSLASTHGELFGTVLVPKAEELIAAPYRFEGDREKAKSFFETGLQTVFQRMRSFGNPEFPTTVYYAFKQAESESETEADDEGASQSRASTGWETMLTALIEADWQIDGTWPMRSEMGNRLVASGTNALASSIVLVCRPRAKDAAVASRRDFLAALKKELPDALRDMQKGNIAPVDLAQAAIGPGMAVFSRYARVLEADGAPMSVRTALALINQSLDEVLAEQEGEFDADTRWALAWFDQNGFNEGAYGTAETLSTAKNTSVSGMVEAGIVTAKGGKVRLLKKDELPTDWDPATDERLTVWEATHHLIRSLDSGEQAAAALLKSLGAMAEVARDLSYRLYTVCERRKWSQDAIGYNALVLSWPDLKRLADEQKAAGPAQGELI